MSKKHICKTENTKAEVAAKNILKYIKNLTTDELGVIQKLVRLHRNLMYFSDEYDYKLKVGPDPAGDIVIVPNWDPRSMIVLHMTGNIDVGLPNVYVEAEKLLKLTNLVTRVQNIYRESTEHV